MKGAVFIALAEMVEENQGIRAWNEVLDTVAPASGGVYTSVDTYPDEELLAIITALSDKLKVPVSELVKSFGVRLFEFLNKNYPMYVEATPDLFEFLESINDSIHKEVKILYPEAYLPMIQCERESDSRLLMHYSSKRKLCLLAEGLVVGAAQLYGREICFQHRQCMHDGKDHCTFVVDIIG